MGGDVGVRTPTLLGALASRVGCLLVGVACSTEPKQKEEQWTYEGRGSVIDGGWYEIARITCDGHEFVPPDLFPRLAISGGYIAVTFSEFETQWSGYRADFWTDDPRHAVLVSNLKGTSVPKQYNGRGTWEIELKTDPETATPYQELILHNLWLGGNPHLPMAVCGHRLSNNPTNRANLLDATIPDSANPLFGEWRALGDEDCRERRKVPSDIEALHIGPDGFSVQWRSSETTQREHEEPRRTQFAGTMEIGFYVYGDEPYKSGTLSMRYSDAAPSDSKGSGRFRIVSFDQSEPNRPIRKLVLEEMFLGRIDPDADIACGHSFTDAPPEYEITP